MKERRRKKAKNREGGREEEKRKGKQNRREKEDEVLELRKVISVASTLSLQMRVIPTPEQLSHSSNKLVWETSR